jgi:hypothetical protein
MDFREKHEPHLRQRLEPGEELRGICAATQQSTFSGRAVAIGITDRRLLLQPLDRRGEPRDDLLTIKPAEIQSADVDGAGGGWANLGSAVLDATAVTLKLRLTTGDKLKLMLMSGGGSMLGRLGGGEAQQEGVQALADWFARAQLS